EANSISTALTLHPCGTQAQHMCNGTTCAGTYAPNRYGGDCDPDGCDWNPYRNGATGFYGTGKTVDANQMLTVMTQFLTNSAGALNKVVRYYVQNGVLIGTPKATNIPTYKGNTIDENYCPAELSTFGETDYFNIHGGFANVQAGMEAGMVLVLSLWDDLYANMLWLDSTYPTDSTAPSAARGSCSTSSGSPSNVESANANSKVIYSNIKFGAINSTFTYTSVLGGGNSDTSTTSTKTSTSTSATSTSSTKTTTTTLITTTSKSSTSSSSTSSTSTTSSSGATQTHWGQCAGLTYNGPTVCESPWTCQYQNPWYSQCL
ncbi:glycosyl hydrolase family 7-domain-containing protein, partial [Staphylotrichum tortipilum]